MNAFFDLQHLVDAEEIDGQGHVHNLRYLAWTLRAASRHSASLGWDANHMQQVHHCGWVVRSHDVVYRAAAFRDDHIVVRTWVSELSRHAATRQSFVYRPQDKQLLARVSTRWVMVDLQVRRAIAIPADIAGKMQVLASPPPYPDT
jgi:acyl-CoA thioester hydrolase